MDPVFWRGSRGDRARLGARCHRPCRGLDCVLELMGFRLKAVGGKDAGAELAFDQPAVAIGRSPQCDVVVSDPEVSRRHAEIVRVEDSYFLQDLQSSNWTQVNGTAIGRARLSTGDELALGPARFRFSVAAGSTTDRT